MAQQWTPPPPPGGATGTVPNYLVPAILSVFCCTPLGIVAIIFAAQVNNKVAAGDMAGAVDSSKKAKMFAFISIGIGLVGGVIYLLLAILGVAAGNM
ncbi:MAG TPA: CD225/dispanin family protein [Pyrinomonadaceae bacterium]|nr:CD225/dispanin family protein [Pyrinomonadaceae bacterium]